MKPEYLSKLNDEQYDAATYGIQVEGNNRHPPLLIKAGAGTGKTKTSIARATNLIVNGADPERTLIAAFGTDAAKQISTGIEKSVLLATGKSIELPWAGTFHSVGAKLIRLFAQVLGLTPNFQLMSRDDRADLMKSCIDESGAKRKLPKSDICLRLYSIAVESCCPIAVCLTKLGLSASLDRTCAKLFSSYERAKLRRDLVDYEDYLRLSLALFDNNDALRKIRSLFDHVLVDEFQDSSPLQTQLLFELSPRGRGLTVVGDDAQAIYEFRGAAVDGIRNFADGFRPRAKEISLVQNYRSTQPIVNASHAVLASAGIDGNRERCRAHRPGSKKPRLLLTANDREQMQHVVTEIERLQLRGVPLAKMVVMARELSHFGMLRAVLANRGIPFTTRGGGLADYKVTRDVSAILRFCERPDLDLTALRTFKLVNGVGKKSADRIFSAVNGRPDLGVLHSVNFPRKNKAAWQRFAAMISQVTKKGVPWPAQFDALRAWYATSRKLSLKDRSLLKELTNYATPTKSRKEFLDQVLMLERPATSTVSNAIELSTIHGMKGRERRHVWILNVTDDRIPSMHAKTARSVREEARLLHVAMTRAEARLTLVAPVAMTVGWKSVRPVSRTRFISDSDVKSYFKIVDRRSSPPNSSGRSNLKAT